MDALADASCIRIVVPGLPKPLARNRHRIVKTPAGGHYVSSYLPGASRNEQAVIRQFAAEAMYGGPPFTEAIDLRIIAWLPVPQSWSRKRREAALLGVVCPTGRPDLDNYLKLACDALKAIVWRDDSQVVNLTAWKRYSETPMLILEIRLVGA